MSLSTLCKKALNKLILQNQSFANVGDAGGLLPSVAAGVMEIALHTADPTVDGLSTNHEVTDSNYDRASLARSNAGFSVDNLTGQGANAATAAFPPIVDGDVTVSHVSVGFGTLSGGTVYVSGALTVAKTFHIGDIPTFTIGSLTIG